MPITPPVNPDSAQSPNLPRRQLLQGAACLGLMALLTGCTTKAGARLPGPRWPDQEGPTFAGGGQGDTSWSRPGARAPSAAPAPIARPAPVRSVQPVVSGIMPRSAWTNGQPRWNVSKPLNGVRRITIHHDALNTEGGRGTAFAIQRLNSIRGSHMSRGREWVDIGYHYIIDPDGRVWEGRPVSIEGAHVKANNEHNLGIMVMGNFDQQRPTSAQLETLDGFVAAQARFYRVPPSRIFTHQEIMSTACPGRNLQGYMQQTRSRSGRMALMAT